MNNWLTVLSLVALMLSAACALIIAADIIAGHRQRMWIMNIVWPITAFYSGPIGLWAYYRIGRKASHHAKQHQQGQASSEHAPNKPFWQSVAVAATHCGSGCTLGDILAESLLILVPLQLFGREMFAGWVVDFVAAFVIGIAFQYFTIKPMREMSAREGLVAAVKADTLSLTAWQVGMYGWMAVATFLIFGHPLEKTSPVFWFMMQIAMLFGFLTAYPVNWWLLRKGMKETM